jgi:DNA-binding winged helix-turn-helix (wHTH) protein
VEVGFGLFTFNETARELHCGGRPVHLSPKAFDLLAILLRRRPRAASKADLHAELWPDTFVSDGSLAVLVAEIRRALGDSAQHPTYLRTVNRFGYAFNARQETPDILIQTQPASVCFLVRGDERLRLRRGDNFVGRDPTADVCLEAVGISRRHALITVRDGDVVLQDLGSKNGTFVDGIRVTTPTTLGDRAEMRLGALRLTFRRNADQLPTQTVNGSAGIGGSR